MNQGGICRHKSAYLTALAKGARLAFLESALHTQPLPPEDLLFGDHTPHLFFARFSMTLDATWIRTAHPPNITLLDAQLPKVFQTRSTEDVRA